MKKYYISIGVLLVIVVAVFFWTFSVRAVDTFTATPNVVSSGGTSTLAWSIVADSCTASNDKGNTQFQGSVPVSGSKNITNITEPTYFYLNCVPVMGSGTISKITSVDVSSSTPTPTPGGGTPSFTWVFGHDEASELNCQSGASNAPTQTAILTASNIKVTSNGGNSNLRLHLILQNLHSDKATCSKDSSFGSANGISIDNGGHPSLDYTLGQSAATVKVSYNPSAYNCGTILMSGAWQWIDDSTGTKTATGKGWAVYFNYNKTCGTSPTPSGGVQPSVLSAACTNSGLPVVLSWTMPAGSNANALNKTDATLGTSQQIGLPNLSVTTYSDSDLANGHTYKYVHKNEVQTFSNEVTVSMSSSGVCSVGGTATPTPLPAPTLACTNGGKAPPVQVSWQPVSGQTANSVLRGVDGGVMDFVFGNGDTPPFTVFSYTDNNTQGGHKYTYAVKYSASARTYNADVTVAADGTCSLGGSPTPTPTPTPTSTNLLSASCSLSPSPRVNLQWQQRSGQTLNVLNRATDNDPNFSQIFQESGPPFSQFSMLDASPFVSTGHTYRYQVKYDPMFSSNIVAVSFSSTGCSVTADTGTPNPQPTGAALNLAKAVRDVTKGTAEADTISASPGDVLEFIVRAGSVGGTAAQNVRLLDTLPSGVSYVAGTTTVDGAAAADSITGSGLTLGDMAQGRSVTIRFKAQVAAASFFSAGNTSLTNTVSAASTNAPTLQDTAFVNVTSGTGTSQGGISLAKYGRNLAKRESAEQSSVNAAPGDIVEFIIHVRSSGGIVSDIILSDTLPIGMSYLPGTTSVDAVSVSDALLTGSGLNLGSLAAGQEKVIRFSAQVNLASSFTVGVNSLVNTARVQANSISPFIAQLPITVFRAGVAGASQVSTGPLESTLIAFIGALALTLLYFGYTKIKFVKGFGLPQALQHTGPIDFRRGITIAVVTALLVSGVTFATHGTLVALNESVEFSGGLASDQGHVPQSNVSCFVDQNTGGPTCYYNK